MDVDLTSQVAEPIGSATCDLQVIQAVAATLSTLQRQCACGAKHTALLQGRPPTHGRCFFCC